MSKRRFFATPEELRAWFEAHHDRVQEQWVGFYKRGSGRPSITWPEAVDQALCFGWIDGRRRSIDEHAYEIRFTPRRPGSVWSAINLKRAAELERLGLMHPAGLRAYAQRTDEKTAIYAHEQRHAASLDAVQEEMLRANARAWAYFQAQPPWYRKAVAHWIQSAKKEETRARRLQTLITESAAGRAVPPLRRPTGTRSK